MPQLTGAGGRTANLLGGVHLGMRCSRKSCADSKSTNHVALLLDFGGSCWSIVVVQVREFDGSSILLLPSVHSFRARITTDFWLHTLYMCAVMELALARREGLHAGAN